MKKINVLFTGTNLRQIIRDGIMDPPPGVNYKTIQDLNEMQADHKISVAKSTKMLNFILKICEIIGMPNIRYIPRKYLKDIDLIHSSGQMLLTKKPYVIEIEHAPCLAFFREKILYHPIGNRLIRFFLKRKNCRKLICWSRAAKKSVDATFKDKEISQKTDFVYQYIEEPVKRDYDNSKIRFLLISTKFYVKGAKWVLKAFDELSKEYPNIHLTVISFTPKEYIEKYKHNKNIDFVPANLTRDELYKKYYFTHDVFVQPTLKDSFGFVNIEAMRSGMSIITVDIFAIPEMVHEGKNGFLIRPPVDFFNKDLTIKKGMWPIKLKKGKTMEDWYAGIEDQGMVDELKERMMNYIKYPSLAEEMGKYSQKLINEQFSYKIRHKKLARIYNEALQTVKK